MTDETNNEDSNIDEPTNASTNSELSHEEKAVIAAEAGAQSDMPSELDLLKERASRMGLTFHPSIGVGKLNDKIKAHTTSEKRKATIDAKKDTPAPVKEHGRLDLSKPERIIETKSEREKRIRSEALRQVRVRVACMNPNKKNWTGEILKISNSIVAPPKQFVPFDNDEGWHIPYMLYLHLKERQCQVFVAGKGRNGQATAKAKLIREFSVELMDPLTPAEMKALAQRQAMASGQAA